MRSTPIKTQITSSNTLRLTATASLFALSLLAGCRNRDQAALDQAKAQAASTNTPQQVQYIDKNGDTVTTTVQPPVAGQPQQVATTITPPAPGPIPHSTDPVVTPVGSAAANTAQQQIVGQQASGQPIAGQPAANQAMNLTVPAGTELAIRVNQHISVKTSRAGDRFDGEVVEPVLDRNNNVLIPKGTPVGGVIDESHRRGHFKGRSILELRLVSMTLNGNQYPLDTHDSIRTKKGKGKRTAGFIGGMTGAGMLIGGVASGGVGLAIGGAAGAGAGTLLAGATGNRDISIPAESVVHFRLADDLLIQN